MSNWKNTSLMDIIKIFGGGTPKTSVESYWNGNIPWISVKDIKNNNRYIYSTEKHISQEGLDHSSTKMLQKDDIIISARGTVGELAMIPFPMAFNQSCYGIRRKTNIDQTFLYYLIKNCIANLKSIAHGSVFDTITMDTFSNIRINLPDIETQKIIATILAVMDDKIEENERINQNLEQQVSSIYQAWFEDFILSDESMPSEWKYGTLCDIARITSGKRPPVKSTVKTEEATIPLVGATSVMGFTNDANCTKRVLIIGRVGTHGVVQRFNIPCWASDNTLVISSDYYEYTSQILKRIDYSSINRGSTQPLITQGDMNNIAILLPNKATILKFEDIVENLMSKYEENIVENVRLAELRDSLLPMLMSGDLDVSALDI